MRGRKKEIKKKNTVYRKILREVQLEIERMGVGRTGMKKQKEMQIIKNEEENNIYGIIMFLSLIAFE
jgi:hypothetical protein